jgi:hypothetical protein
MRAMIAAKARREIKALFVLAAAIALVAAVLVVRAASGSPERCPEPNRGVLPSWARTGFSDPEPRMPHVVGDDGRIAAILFGDPLSSPPDPERGNKILWVSRDEVVPLSDLRIRAEHDGTVVNRVVRGGPGPSIIEMPEAGCWHMTLRWSGRTDTLSLRYS